jgi:hypothetical protein
MRDISHCWRIGDFYFVDAAEPEEGVRKLLAIVRERIPKRFGLIAGGSQTHFRQSPRRLRLWWMAIINSWSFCRGAAR